MLFREIIEIETAPFACVNITGQVARILDACALRDGLCNVFLPATTAGLVLNEYDRFLLEDFKKHYKTIDDARMYMHPDNAASHLRAALARQEVTIPIANGKLLLGKWQSLLLWEFDTTPRTRKIIITITGEQEEQQGAT